MVLRLGWGVYHLGVYCSVIEELFWSTVGNYSVCIVGCVHFVLYVQGDDAFVYVAYGCGEVCLHVFILCVAL